MPGSASVFTPLGGVAILFAGWATFMVVASLSGGLGAPGLVGLVLGELALMAVPGIAAWRAGVPEASLGLRRPAGIYVLSGLLIGCSLWYLNWRAVVAIEIPSDRVKVLAETVGTVPLPLSLVAMAVVPALCEEIMFRGVVLRSFAGAWPPWVAVVVSAALFSAYHISLPQALPTFTLGLALGALALRSGSVYPTMIGHFVNNVFPVLLTHDRPEALGTWLIENELYATVGAATLVIAGLTLMLVPPRVDDVIQPRRRT